MKVKKLFKYIIITFLVFIIMLTTAGYIIWNNEISSIMSIELLRDRNDSHQDGAVYKMNIKGDYYLDDFIKQGGVKDDKELISFVSNKITKGFIEIGIDSPEIGCSSFTVKNNEGDALFARNYDFSKTNTCLVFTEKNKGRHASISTSDLQFLGIDVNKNIDNLMDKVICLAATYAPLDGINDAGVACGIYMTYQGNEKTIPTNQNTDKPDMTSTTFLRLVLDYADDLDEAIEIAKAYDLHDSADTSYHYMIADASGRSAILEWVNEFDVDDNDGSKRTLKVTYNDQDEYIGEREANSDYQVVTNFIIQPGYYDKSKEEDKKGYDRYEALYQALDKTNGIVKDEQEAMDILSIVGRRSWKNDDGNGCTVHSVIYNMTDKSVTWIPNENYSDKNAVYKYTLKD